jgi:C1A family cysteine protease
VTIARYGWARDLPDHRDRYWQAPALASAQLPPMVDLRPQCPPVYDQGQLGSCTANAIAGAVQFDEIRSGIAPTWTPSRLFIYYNERALEGTVSADSGAQIRDGIKVIAKLGVCPESDWPYDITKFAEKPPATAYGDADHDRIGAYQRLNQSLAQFKACVASGFMFVFGFTVFSSFETPDVNGTGVIPLPQPSESSIGGHAVGCVGYDDAKAAFIIRNSWGAGWGVAGYGFMPYAYMLDPGLAADFWTIQAAPGGPPLRLRHTGSASQRAEDD